MNPFVRLWNNVYIVEDKYNEGFQLRQRVLSLFANTTTYYPCTMLKLPDDGKVTVQYDDGSRETQPLYTNKFGHKVPTIIKIQSFNNTEIQQNAINYYHKALQTFHEQKDRKEKKYKMWELEGDQSKEVSVYLTPPNFRSPSPPSRVLRSFDQERNSNQNRKRTRYEITLDIGVTNIESAPRRKKRKTHHQHNQHTYRKKTGRLTETNTNSNRNLNKENDLQDGISNISSNPLTITSSRITMPINSTNCNIFNNDVLTDEIDKVPPLERVDLPLNYNAHTSITEHRSTDNQENISSMHRQSSRKSNTTSTACNNNEKIPIAQVRDCHLVGRENIDDDQLLFNGEKNAGSENSSRFVIFINNLKYLYISSGK